MHVSSLLRMNWFVQNFLLTQTVPISILDVGSYDVNGSYRPLFQDKRFDYTGLDIEAGPNVDIIVTNPYSWKELADESFDVIISGQAFEHIEFFWLTLSEMLRVLKCGGFLCITAPRDEKRHRYPLDAYRFDTDGMIALAKYGNLKILHASTNLAPLRAPREFYSSSGDSLLIAQKPLEWTGLLDHESYRLVPHEEEAYATGFIPFDQQEALRFLDLSQYLQGRKLVLFGAGYVGAEAIAKISPLLPISYICDNNKKKHGQKIGNIEIKEPEALANEDWGATVVMITIRRPCDRTVLTSQLFGFGVTDIIFYDDISD